MDLKNAAGQTPRNLCTMHEQDEDEEICAKAEKIASLFNEVSNEYQLCNCIRLFFIKLLR